MLLKMIQKKIIKVKKTFGFKGERIIKYSTQKSMRKTFDSRKGVEGILRYVNFPAAVISLD